MSVRTRDEATPRLKFYTTEQIGRTQEATPEGFLICRDVPIARLGTMLYGPDEIPLDPGRDGLIRVDRSPDDLFRPETIASFEGKPVTDDHPDEDVDPANWRKLARGSVLNVRRGANPQDDLLLADLLIMDAAMIEAVQSGKREISCGYDADYEQTEPGRGAQRNIIGNHVALVEQGRCGPRCAIGDRKMAQKPKRTWKDRILTAFRAKDEAALEEALEGAPEDGEEGDGRHHIIVNVNGAPAATTAAAETEDEGEGTPPEDPMKAFTEALAKISARLDAVEARGTQSTGDEDPNPDETYTEDEEPDEEKDKNKEGRTTDSVSLRAEFQDTVARAEILSPGIKLPTFDAKTERKKTSDTICALRRKALKAAFAKDETRKHVAPFVAGDSPDFSKLTCDAARLAFIGASELAKSANNAAVAPRGFATADAGMRDSIKDMNKRNAEFWNGGNRR
ncbi:DUF2213 domain-containing protein [Labrys neptuniae]